MTKNPAPLSAVRSDRNGTSEAAKPSVAYVLIAAASDLLASEQENLTVLENLLTFLRKHRDRLPPISLASLEVRIEKTRAAIAKAAGEVAS
jgi:hypothetical protein